MNLHQLLLGPVVTEKSTRDQAQNKYALIVKADASKVDIKNFFKQVYNVNVVRVNILKRDSKFRFGKGRRLMEKRPAHKRAIITVKAGEKLNLSQSKVSA